MTVPISIPITVKVVDKDDKLVGSLYQLDNWSCTDEVIRAIYQENVETRGKVIAQTNFRWRNGRERRPITCEWRREFTSSVGYGSEFCCCDDPATLARGQITKAARLAVDCVAKEAEKQMKARPVRGIEDLTYSGEDSKRSSEYSYGGMGISTGQNSVAEEGGDVQSLDGSGQSLQESFHSANGDSLNVQGQPSDIEGPLIKKEEESKTSFNICVIA